MSKGERPIDRIAPDGFADTWGADTVDDALEYAHKFGESSTPRERRPRCPVDGCSTVRIAPLPGYDGQKDYDADYKCEYGHRFDSPAPPLAEVEDDDRDDGVDLADVRGVDLEAEPGDAADRDPFEWVDDDDLAAPPIRRLVDAADDRTLTALAIFLYRPWAHTDADPPYRELGALFGYSRQWVGERVRAWKDGEHRDLVRDPRPRLSGVFGE
ncbi:hypothetical protein [Halobellus marinus]|uniref:hypothetical protein n=1 Tax=Halobellus sp. GCM10025813 TaxID=3252665 RepID=UPI00361EE499